MAHLIQPIKARPDKRYMATMLMCFIKYLQNRANFRWCSGMVSASFTGPGKRLLLGIKVFGTFSFIATSPFICLISLAVEEPGVTLSHLPSQLLPMTCFGLAFFGWVSIQS